MNPFREGIVASPWETTGVDVNAIHDDVFQECLRGIEHVRRSHKSASLLIHGEAGSGKTHLLKRLRSRLAPSVPASTDRQEYLFVWVRLQTSPRMIWRTVRRTLVEDWFRPTRGLKSQFERILFHRLAQIRTAEGDLDRWYDFMLEEHPEGLKELIDQIADFLHLDRNTAVAFEHIAFRRHLRDLRAWLAGDSLPEAALNRLEMSQYEGTDEEREADAREVVRMLCRLAGETLPILISFDQVEALELYPGDRDGLYAFGQVTSTLHDGTDNVFIVSCVQSTFANELKDHARTADYARMTSLGARSLEPLTRSQAEQLIAARLNDAGRSDVKPAGADSFWPLTSQNVADLFPERTFPPKVVTPRNLLALCAERYEVETQPQHTPEAARPVEVPAVSDPCDAFLQETWEALLQNKLSKNAPEHTEEIIRHGFPLLLKLLEPDTKSVREELLQDVQLVYERAGERTGLAICTHSNMTSLASVLKRLQNQLGMQKLKRLVIVRDERVPISKTAKKAQSSLQELEQDPRTAVLHPSQEALAALDALRALSSDAKSGDLAWHGQSISSSTLDDWLRQNLSRDLRGFSEQVFGPHNRRSVG